jgi:type I restriction enzyme S subunit
MSLNPYPQYKDSGIEWLGRVPEHWHVRRLKFLCDIQTGAKDTENAVDGGRYPFFVRSQTVERIDSCAFDCEAVLTAGDGAGVGKVFHHHVGAFDFHQRVYMLNTFRGVSGRFIFHYLRENFYKVALDGGAKSTVDSLRRPLFTNFAVAVPPDAEQEKIVAFVDREAAKIDALVAEQERLIEFLKEKRQTVISHAVTRGLNPNVPMKDSGVEWLGEIPEHWGVERGRFLFRKLELPPERNDGVVTAFRDGQVTLRENRRTDGFTIAVLEGGYQRVRTGDLVLHGMDAFAGAIGVSESTGKCTPEYSVLTPLRDDIVNGYFAMVLRLMAQRDFILVICPSVRERAPRFRFEAFKDVVLPVPPLREQREILALIESASHELQSLTAEAQRAIDLLQERRTALISAAVTGQIDVRNLAGRAA